MGSTLLGYSIDNNSTHTLQLTTTSTAHIWSSPHSTHQILSLRSTSTISPRHYYYHSSTNNIPPCTHTYPHISHPLVHLLSTALLPFTPHFPISTTIICPGTHLTLTPSGPIFLHILFSTTHSHIHPSHLHRLHNFLSLSTFFYLFSTSTLITFFIFRPRP